MQTDRTLLNNEPDIITRDDEKGTRMLINVAIPEDRNVITKKLRRFQHIKKLTIEIQRMWNVEAKEMPVIIRATGTISKSLRKYLNKIEGKHEIKEKQTTAILGTAYILQELPCKSKGKGKAIPLQTWTDCEGSRRLGLPDFMTIGT